MLVATLSFQYLRRQLTRTLVLGGAIATASLVAVLALSFSSGVNAGVTDASTNLIGGHVNVIGVFKPRADKAFTLVPDVKKVEDVIKANVPELVDITYRHRFPLRMVRGDRSVVVAAAMGVDVEHDGLSRVAHLVEQATYREGGADRVLGDLQRLREPNSVALFADHAKELRVDVGDTISLRATTVRNVENVVDVTVVAVVGNVGLQTMWYTFVNKHTMSQLLGVPESASGMLSLRLRSLDDTAAVMTRLPAALRKAGFKPMPALKTLERTKMLTYSSQAWTGEKLVVASWEDELWANHWILEVMAVLHVGLLLLISAVIGIGVANASLMAARERTPQVGLLRALGMPRWKVMLQLTLEMLLLTLLATGVGALLGIALTGTLNAMDIIVTSDAFTTGTMSNKLQLAIDWKLLGILFGAIGAVSVLGSLAGGIRAIRIQPTVAFRHVD